MATTTSTPYDIYFIGVIFMLNVVMDTWLIVKNPGYALPLFGATFSGAWGWLAKIQSPILHGVLGYGFLRRRRWGYWLYMAYAAFGLSSALVNLATIGFGRIRIIFIVSLTLISVYIFTRRRVFS
ncbi:MAG: hypothetical protein ACOYXR_10410 [Nitrospirota bacterium]